MFGQIGRKQSLFICIRLGRAAIACSSLERQQQKRCCNCGSSKSKGRRRGGSSDNNSWPPGGGFVRLCGARMSMSSRELADNKQAPN